MSRSSLARLALASFFVFCLPACRDFTVPRIPETRDVAVEPDRAFGEQEIALRFDGQVDLAKVQVSIGGKLAALPAGQSGDGVVKAVVPRLADTCDLAVPVLVTAPGFFFNAATLRYLGVGHPGTPRPTLSSRTRSVAFLPTSAASLPGKDGTALVTSGNGEAVLVVPLGGAAGERVAAVWRQDFVLGLASPGMGLVVDATAHGQVEQFTLGNYVPWASDRNATGNELGTPAPPDLACYLPSALSEPPSMALLAASVGDDVASDPGDAGIVPAPRDEDAGADLAGPDAGHVSYQGMLLTAAPLSAWQLDSDEKGLSRSSLAKIETWMGGARASVAALDDEALVLVKGGATPVVRVVDADGESLAGGDFAIASQGDEWTVSATGGAGTGYAVAYLRASLGLDGRLLLVARPGAAASEGCAACDGSQTCTLGGAPGLCVPDQGACSCVAFVDCASSCDGPCATKGGFGWCGSAGLSCSACVPLVDCASAASCQGACLTTFGLPGTCSGSGGQCRCGAAGPGDECLVDGQCVVDGFCGPNGLLGTCQKMTPEGCGCVFADSACDGAACGGLCAAGGKAGWCGLDPGGACACIAGGEAPPDSDGGMPQPAAPDAGESAVPPPDDGGRGGGGGGEPPDAGPSLFELPVHGASLTSLAVDRVHKTVYGVDGVSPWLYAWSIAAQSGEPERLQPAQSRPLAEPGTRVLVVSVKGSSGAEESVPVVVGRSGALYQGPGFDARQVRLGLSSVAPLARSSCEAPSAVVSAAEIGATVVVPTTEGAAAFLEGVPEARFADTVTFERDGGLPLAYFFSGGVIPPPDAGRDAGDEAAGPEDAATGFAVSQTTAQTWAESPGGGLPKKSDFHFSARAATALLTDERTAVFVVGSPEGLRFVPMQAGRLPREGEDSLDRSCPDVRKLARLAGGSAGVFALARREVKADGSVAQLLCLADAATGQVATRTVDWPVLAVAAGATLEDQEVVHHLWTLGWEESSGSLALALRHGDGDATGRAALDSLSKVEWGASARQLLPQGGAPVSAMAVSPDGRRLLVALAGERPGLLAIDPWPFLHSGSEAEKAAALTTLWLQAAPVGIGFTADGARAIVALSDDTLAFVE